MITVLAIVLAALAGAWSPAPARADGDPASDVLVGQTLFLADDAGVSPRVQAQLTALLAAAQHGGVPIRVAVIAAPGDLGSVGALWRQPESYAQFLGSELSLVYRGELLVVMPDGFGTATVGRRPGAAPTALAGLRPSGSGAVLGTAARSAVLRLASAAGLHLAVPDASVRSVAGSVDIGAWVAFGAGAAVMLLAWGASVRAKPLALRSRGAPSAAAGKRS